MANPRTQKKRMSDMRKLCAECASNPNACPYLKYREYRNLCMWRQPK